MARTFLNENRDETARNLFEIVRDLTPDLMEEPAVVLRQELEKYVGGGAVDCIMRGARKAEAWKEIVKLANGKFDDRARSFIQTRDKNFRRDHPIIGQTNLEGFKKKPPDKKLRTFEEVFNYYESHIPIFVEQMLNATPAQASGIAERIDEFPLLRSIVRANLYLVFVAVAHKATAATDKIDDHRHVIDASYCDIFVTEERQLLSNVRKLNPDLEPVKWSTLGKIRNLSST